MHRDMNYDINEVLGSSCVRQLFYLRTLFYFEGNVEYVGLRSSGEKHSQPSRNQSETDKEDPHQGITVLFHYNIIKPIRPF